MTDIRTIKLTPLGMSMLGEELGITDENSPILKDINIFYNRVDLYTYIKDIRGLIEVYSEELNKFNSELEYVAYILDEEEKMYNKINKLLNNISVTRFNRSISEVQFSENLNDSMFNSKFEDKKLLQVSINNNNKLLNALKYWELIDNNILTNKDLIMSFTECEYLAERGTLDTSKLKFKNSRLVDITIQDLMIEIADLVSQILNKRQLAVFDKNGTIAFNIGNTISVNTLNSIMDVLNNTEIKEKLNIGIDIETATILKTMDNSDMLTKLSMYGMLEFGNCNPIELHYILRKLYRQKATDADRVFEMNGITCIASSMPSQRVTILDNKE